MGYVYLHFGFLKFFPDLSPAELIGTQTVMAVTGHMFDASKAQFLLAILECAIGIGLCFNVFPRIVLGLFVFHMAGTFAPLWFFPELTFKIAPFAPNLEGQYIFKNIVFIAAGWTVFVPEIFAAKQDATVSVFQPSVNNVSTVREQPTHEEVLS